MIEDMNKTPKDANTKHTKHDPRPDQSVPLLKALHILTREGKLNQDSRRKLKQVNHLMQFIKPLIDELATRKSQITIVDHGSGKSYLGFMLYDAFFKPVAGQTRPKGRLIGVETRNELVQRAQSMAREFGFENDMQFLNLTVQAAQDKLKDEHIDIVTALHACDTATDDAIQFAIQHRAEYVVLVPCCQAEVAACIREDKPKAGVMSELWRHPMHAREFGSQLTNVLRSLQLEAAGYQVTVTELVGWEHSMKNELIIAKHTQHSQQTSAPQTKQQQSAKHKLDELLNTLGLNALRPRFFTGLV